MTQEQEQIVGDWLLSTAHWLERALNAAFEEHGITYRQFQVLACLAMRGEMTQAELAETLGIEPPTVVRVLDRMERDGWIQRHDDPGDRRKKIIRPTKRVEPAWQQFLACSAQVRLRATSGLSPAEINLLVSALQRVRSNLGTKLYMTSANLTQGVMG